MFLFSTSRFEDNFIKKAIESDIVVYSDLISLYKVNILKVKYLLLWVKS